MTRRRIAFIYGAREVIWPGIVQSLMAEGGVVAETLVRCDEFVRTKLGWSLGQIMMYKGEHAPEHALEPILTAVQIALTDGWRERGLVPDAVGARSGGEFAAAYARGALSLEDALELACRISLKMRDDPVSGCIVGVRQEVSVVERLQRSSEIEFTIAADDPHWGTIVACPTENLAALSRYFDGRDIKYECLPIPAYHSAAMQKWRDGMVSPLSGPQPTLPRCPGYSAITGGLIDDTTSVSDYLWKAIRERVFIKLVLRKMICDDYSIFIEIGGHPCLSETIRDVAGEMGKTIVSIGSMRRQTSFADLKNESFDLLMKAGFTPDNSSLR